MDKEINLLMAGNNKVFEGICLTVLSVLKHTKIPIHFYLMTMTLPGTNQAISTEQSDSLCGYIMRNNPSNRYTLIDTTADYQKCFAHSPNKNAVYTPYSLIRLFAQRHLDCDRVLYLDADTMACSSLEEFCDLNIDDVEMAVALDYLGKFWIRKDYFNSGVLYINMKKVRETNLFERTVALLGKKRFFLADQSALNQLCKHKIYLPMRFNEQRDIKSDTVIKHFNKGIKWLPFFHVYCIKQWQRQKVHKKLRIHDFDDIYRLFDKEFKQVINQPLVVTEEVAPTQETILR